MRIFDKVLLTRYGRHRKPLTDQNGSQASPRKPLSREADGTFGTMF
jgi:hypothetical protein